MPAEEVSPSRQFLSTMVGDRLRDAVPDGEALRYSASPRSRDAVGLTDDRLLLTERDGSVTSVEYASIEEVTAEDYDWFLGVLSVGLVAFGVLSFDRNLFLGGAFALAGLASLYRVYQNRGEVRVDVRDRAKPLTFHLDDAETFLSRLEPLLAEYESRLQERMGTAGPHETRE
jgi:hypothetical protein